MGETLELSWLIDTVAPIEKLLTESEPLEALLTVQELVTQIRQKRDSYLESLDRTVDEPAFVDSSEENVFSSEYEADEPDGKGEFFNFGEDEDEAEQSTVMFAPTAVSKEKIATKVAQVAAAKTSTTVEQVKIPLERLQDMTNNVEELILTYSRFGRQQELLNQANRRLRSLTRQFEPIREQIQNLYDELAIGSSRYVCSR